MTLSYLDHDDSRRADNEVQVTFSQSMNLIFILKIFILLNFELNKQQDQTKDISQILLHFYHF